MFAPDGIILSVVNALHASCLCLSEMCSYLRTCVTLQVCCDQDNVGLRFQESQPETTQLLHVLLMSDSESPGWQHLA